MPTKITSELYEDYFLVVIEAIPPYTWAEALEAIKNVQHLSEDIDLPLYLIQDVRQQPEPPQIEGFGDVLSMIPEYPPQTEMVIIVGAGNSTQSIVRMTARSLQKSFLNAATLEKAYVYIREHREWDSKTS